MLGVLPIVAPVEQPGLKEYVMMLATTADEVAEPFRRQL
jgi:hypothetical protein